VFDGNIFAFNDVRPLLPSSPRQSAAIFSPSSRRPQILLFRSYGYSHSRASGEQYGVRPYNWHRLI